MKRRMIFSRQAGLNFSASACKIAESPISSMATDERRRFRVSHLVSEMSGVILGMFGRDMISPSFLLVFHTGRVYTV